MNNIPTKDPGRDLQNYVIRTRSSKTTTIEFFFDVQLLTRVNVVSEWTGSQFTRPSKKKGRSLHGSMRSTGRSGASRTMDFIGLLLSETMDMIGNFNDFTEGPCVSKLKVQWEPHPDRTTELVG